MNRIYTILVLCVMMLSACKKDVDQALVDRQKIEAYLDEQGLTAEVDPSGLYYIIESPGTGERPEVTDNVRVRYKGYLLDGTVFDQTPADTSRVFNLQGLIPGWQIALPLLREGGKGIFIHPSALAYGERPPGGVIGPNEVLIFEIELIEVVDQEELDRQRIEAYLAENGLTAEVHPSGLHYIIEEPGTGAQADEDDTVVVKYTGYLLDGTIFDRTPGDTTAEFELPRLIEGWQIAIQLLKEGGRGTFIHPSGLAYGARPPFGSPIGPNEVLIFEIELVQVK